MKVKYFMETVEKMMKGEGASVSVRMNGHNGDTVAGILANRESVILLNPKDFRTADRYYKGEPIKTENGAELLEAVKSCRDDAVIRLDAQYGDEVLFASMREGDNVLYLETAKDACMEAQISGRLRAAAEEQEDEADVYQELLDTGIDPDMVRNYLDRETGDHMEVYCKEHGLI